MKLYCFGESGNAYKCALALTLADMDWEPVFVDFFNGEARTPNSARSTRWARCRC
jgi:glutathione S-transferase